MFFLLSVAINKYVLLPCLHCTHMLVIRSYTFKTGYSICIYIYESKIISSSFLFNVQELERSDPCNPRLHLKVKPQLIFSSENIS